MMNESIISDDFRFINSLNTTARRLSVCTQIVKIISRQQLPKEIVKNSLISWSNNKEITDSIYNNSKGKITEKGKPTSSFDHYLNLCTELKLVSRFNQIYSSSKISSVLEYISTEEISFIHSKSDLTDLEGLFYFLIILKEDADGVLLIFNILNSLDGIASQKELLAKFKENFNIRLIAKQSTTNVKLNNDINEKMRALNYSWQKAEIYAEHLIIPRCEWLSDIGLLKIHKSGSKTLYEFNESSKKLMALLPIIEGTNVYDINENWYYSKSAECFIESTLAVDDYKLFNDLIFSEKEKLIIEKIEEAKHVVQTSSTNRVPVFDTLLYIILKSLKSNNIITNFDELIILLRQGISFENKEYHIKEQARKNEGYISIIAK